jgi:hypothetical protein
MRYICIITLLVLCLTLLLLTGCITNTVTPEIDNGNLENQTVEEPAVEEPAIEESATTKVDTTKPVITGSRAPLPNSFGWNNTDVAASFSCEDVGPIQSGIKTNTVAGKTVTTEGKDQSVTNTGECIDAAGNVADPVTVSNINIDKTPPVVTLTLPGNGKYGLNESVTATWSATDTLSGAEDSKTPKTIKIDTSSMGKKKITLPAGIAKDKAGNSSQEVTTSYEVLEADTTKPVITGSRAPLPNSFGWNNTDVTVSFSCADTGSVQSGIAINTVAGKTLTTEGKGQSVTNTGVCIDAAGNTADPVTISNINIDKTPPVVTITLPGTGEYVLNQSITATWSATDALSGVVSPVSGSVSIDTSSVGTKTFTLPAGTAKDKAGNSSLKVTKSYSVIVDTEEPGTVYPQKWATGTGTVSNPWANDCIKKAYDVVPVGGTIFLKAGYYKLSSILYTETKNFNLIGEGMDKSIIVLDTGNSYGIYIYETDYCTFKGFTIDGAAQGDNTKPTIYIYNCNYTIVEDVEAKNAGTFGIDCGNSSYSYFHNIYAHDNYDHGVHGGVSIQGRNTNNVYRDIYCWNNGLTSSENGFDDFGYQIAHSGYINNNVYDNLQCWDNGSRGIALQYLKGCTLSNSFASGNDVNGIWISLCEDLNIHDCFVTLSEEHGIVINDSDNISFVNVVSKNNNGESGIYINSSNGLRFTSCQSYDDRETMLQDWGLRNGEGSTADYIELTNCILMPNKIAAIYNGSGTVIAVITEKMLAKF